MRRFATILFVLFLSIPALSQERVGQIIAVEGKVYVKHPGSSWKRASKGEPVFRKSIVRTSRGARAAISFTDGSKLMLGDTTIVSIEKFLLKRDRRHIRFFIFKGKLKSIVSPFKGISSVEVRSQGAIAGVRGTRFVFYHKPPVNLIYTLRGKVQSTSPGTGSWLVVKEGELTENTQGRRLITPDKVPAQIREAIELLLKSTDIEVPESWKRSGKLPLILARWNINYGHYLIDKKRYLDAAEAFQIAHDLTQNPSLRAESLVNKASVYSDFIKDYPKAAYELRKVLTYYPDTPFAETALYRLGLLYVQTDNREMALKILNRYLVIYPQGRYASSVKSLIKQLR